MTDFSPKENKQNIRFRTQSRDDSLKSRISTALHEMEVEANSLIDLYWARSPTATVRAAFFEKGTLEAQGIQAGHNPPPTRIYH
jgi:hypothetical protein